MFKRLIAKMLGIKLDEKEVTVQLHYKDGTVMACKMSSFNADRLFHKISSVYRHRTFRTGDFVFRLNDVRMAVILPDEQDISPVPEPQGINGNIPSDWSRWIKEEEQRDREMEEMESDY